MRRLSFEIPGKPGAKQRPRHTRNGHTYTPEETVNYENLVKVCFREKYPGFVPIDEAVVMDISAAFPIPESWSKKKKMLALKSDIYPRKPDWDNIGKIVSDALNGIAYTDDSLVSMCVVSKYYSSYPHVSVTIMTRRLDENE